jgi:hypothetical protein
MAAPNLLNLTTVTAKILGAALTTSNTTILTNTSGSNKVFKINSIVVSNIDGSSSADVTVSLYKNATTEYYLAYTVLVPPDSTFVAATKDMQIFLEENDAIRGLASANGDLHMIISYEEIA